jgi:hypothetical protein
MIGASVGGVGVAHARMGSVARQGCVATAVDAAGALRAARRQVLVEMEPAGGHYADPAHAEVLRWLDALNLALWQADNARLVVTHSARGARRTADGP